VTPNNIVL